MYHLTIINPDKIECSKRVYNNLHAALSDVFTRNLAVDVGDTECPTRIYTGGTLSSSGYDDEFYFKYPSGYVVCIGLLIVEDEGKEIKL